MSGTEAEAGNPDCQNLSDIQNYLVSFNKEIEGGEQPHFQAAALAQISTTSTSPQETEETPAEKDEPGVSYDTIYYDGQTLLTPSQDHNTSDVPVSVPIEGFVVTSDVEAAEEGSVNQTASGILVEPPSVKEDILDAAEQLSAVHAQIAELSGSGEVHVSGDFETVSEQEGISETPVEVPDGVITTTTNVGDHTVRMVSSDAQHPIQMSEELTHTVDMSQFTEEALQADENIRQPTQEQIQQIVHGASIMEGSDPVAVLASVAASASNALSGLQTVTMSQPELHGAQLVALQSSDSSQPQLVAVQAPDGSGAESIVMGTSEVSALANGQVILNAPGNNYQTVTIMPSDLNQGGEVSYVLIVSQPEGDNVARGVGSDMSVYDFTRDDTREVIEEIIDEHGTARKIIRLKKPGSPGSPSQLMCHYCNYTSPKRYLLTRHMKSHSQERPHKCGICNRGFKTLASLQNHVNTHTGLRPHKCRQCESSFTTSGELVRHVRYRHSFEKPHKCTECEYASVELSKLKRHMRSHTGERPYHCPHCPYASPDAYKLKRHLRIHTGEKPYECDICQSRFTQSNSLKAHRLIHSGNKPVYQCELCPTTCGRKTDLKIHMQKLHTAEEPLECDRCLQTFPDRYQFKVHIRTHEGEKCYKCEKCEYAALSKRHLDSHMLTHTGEKPYECDGCGQSFRQKQLLKRHKNLYHTPEYIAPSPKNKLFYCAECDRSFAHKGNLMRHMALHDPDNPIYRVYQTTEGPSTEMLQRNIRTELQEGRLTNPAGKAPQVVIVHLDGRVEEINPGEVVEEPTEDEEKSADAMVDLAMQTLQSTITGAVQEATAEEIIQETGLAIDPNVKVVRVGGKPSSTVSSEDVGITALPDPVRVAEIAAEPETPAETQPEPEEIPSTSVSAESSTSLIDVTQEAGTQVEFESDEDNDSNGEGAQALMKSKTEDAKATALFTQEANHGQQTVSPDPKTAVEVKSPSKPSENPPPSETQPPAETAVRSENDKQTSDTYLLQKESCKGVAEHVSTLQVSVHVHSEDASMTEPSGAGEPEVTTEFADTSVMTTTTASQTEKGEGDVQIKTEFPTPRRRGRPPSKKRPEGSIETKAKTKDTPPSTPPVTPVRGRMSTRSSPKGLPSPVVKPSQTTQSPDEKNLRTHKRKLEVETSPGPKRSRRLEIAKQSGSTGKK